MKKKVVKTHQGKVGFCISYIIMLVQAVIFALYANALTGWFVLFVFILLPILSFAHTFFSQKTINVEVFPFASTTAKGEKLDITVVAENKGFLPTPAIELIFASSETAKISGTTKHIMYIPPKSSVSLNITYNINIWGEALVGIKGCHVCGPFGFIRLAMGQFCVVSDVGIIPDIAEIPADSPIVRSVRDMSTYGEESEDTKSSSTSLLGMAGSEHREYIEGDPIKRINWKLSARIDNLMVRLSEETFSSGHLAVLDYSNDKLFVDESSIDDLMEIQRSVEGFLGLLMLICRLGFDCTAMVRKKREWHSFTVERYDDIIPISHFLADYRFEKNASQRLPDDEIAQSKAAIICTPFYSKDLEQMVDKYNSAGCKTVVMAASGYAPGNDVWTFDNDFTSSLVSDKGAAQ